MWTTNGWFGFTREQIATLQEGTLYEATDEKSAREAALKFSSKPENKDNTYHVNKTGEKHYVSLYPSKNDVAVYKGGECIREAIHRIDWDGASDVKVMKRTPDEIEVRRVDAQGKPLSGDEHSMIISKDEPEFRQISDREQEIDDSEAWREKRAAALQGRYYHEGVDEDTIFESLKSMSAKDLKSYIAQLKKERDKVSGPVSSNKMDTLTGKISKAESELKARKPDMNESTQYLSEAFHGVFELTSGKKTDMTERAPDHVVAHVRKMNKLGVPVHDKDDYGTTVSVKVKNTVTGATTHHHVYQRGKSSREDESSKRLVSVRPVGRSTPDTQKHNQVIKDYLAGKRSSKE